MGRHRIENSNKRKTDQKLNVCKKCDRVWEEYWTPNGELTFDIYPKGNIPKIGKRTRDCPRCIAKKI